MNVIFSPTYEPHLFSFKQQIHRCQAWRTSGYDIDIIAIEYTVF